MLPLTAFGGVPIFKFLYAGIHANRISYGQTQKANEKRAGQEQCHSVKEASCYVVANDIITAVKFKNRKYPSFLPVPCAGCAPL
jgi:hypothetical protein